MIRIDSSNYDDIQGPSLEQKKFDNLRYSIVGSADYVAIPVIASAWTYNILVSASASGIAGGISAGGVDSLYVSFNKTTALTFVTDFAVTATGWMRGLKMSERLDPTNYVFSFQLVKA